GAPFPDVIPDEFHPTPLTSYGTQKQMSEALLADYTRRGFFDGIGIRLPTICVRPGKPNKAASSFFSGIIREPLAGQQAILPVPRSVLHTHASPRSA
ncbi:NAD-dependent epimerase, partial [Mesorhizobium sp. M8A.F.Ca.ET.198.01.1.1]